MAKPKGSARKASTAAKPAGRKSTAKKASGRKAASASKSA